MCGKISQNKFHKTIHSQNSESRTGRFFPAGSFPPKIKCFTIHNGGECGKGRFKKGGAKGPWPAELLHRRAPVTPGKKRPAPQPYTGWNQILPSIGPTKNILCAKICVTSH